ncbi:hypothetical protein B0H13DRAFT_1894234 [Mycena leptocephala]|nr:hypothetical protein B0H13DRAFT_1894234 [Mycena leptocephala]
MSTSEINSATPPTSSPRAARLPAAQRSARVIIRFDQEPHSLPRPLQCNPADLDQGIVKVLRPLMDRTAHQKQRLAGVQWTKGGNIALHPAAEMYTAKFLVDHSNLIWSSIRPLLGFTEDRKCPVFDTDGQWHSVVFHGVPMPQPPTGALEFYATHREQIEHWVTSPASQGQLRDYSVLSRRDDLEKKSSLALRLSFSLEADAERLIKNGGYMFGVSCRVSRYVPKKRSPSPP